MRAVLLDQNTFIKGISLTSLKLPLTELTCYPSTSQSELLARCENIEIIITNKVILSASTLAKSPHVKLICIAATGTNNVDLNAARTLNIAVTNVSGYANQAVSQYIFAQLLEYYSHTHHHHKNAESGLWSKSSSFCYHGNGSSELAGKSLGIIGYGDLGQAVAKIAKAFDMQVLIAERAHSTTIRPNRIAFDTVVKTADIISLHCPQTTDTEQLINKQFLQKMKKSALLINSARGALVDNQALHDALKNKQIAYAILDVLDQEPPSVDHLLLTNKLDNIKITAHIAWASIEAQQRLLDSIATNISDFYRGEKTNRVD